MADTYTVKAFENRETLEEALYTLLKDLFQAATVEEPYAVMLSGGSTPAALYERIAQSGVRAGDGLYILLSDERLVPSESTDANLTMVKPMAEAIGLPADRLIAVQHDRPGGEAAREYHDELTRLNEKGVSRRLALLGVGGDGHTASLFAPEEAKRAHAVLADQVPRHAGFERVTATPEELLSYRRIVFFAAGEKKRPILESLLRRPEAYPAGIIARRFGSAELWTDQRLDAGGPGGSASPGAGTPSGSGA